MKGFTTTSKSKTKLSKPFSPAFENAEVRISDDPVLISELEAYEIERLLGSLRAQEGQTLINEIGYIAMVDSMSQ